MVLLLFLIIISAPYLWSVLLKACTCNPVKLSSFGDGIYLETERCHLLARIITSLR